jgi:hypothetical protein
VTRPVSHASRASRGSRVSRAEQDLITRLLTTVLREDVAGLRSRGRLVRSQVRGADWLALGPLRIPVRPGRPELGDLVTDLAARAPFVRTGRPGRRGRQDRLHAVLNQLSRHLVTGLDPALAEEFGAGFAALRDEARAALDGAELRRQRRPHILSRLRPELTGAAGTGWAGALGYETLAAHRDHPLAPFSLARVGLRSADLPRFAPEHRPELRLRWLSVPSATIEQSGVLPDWWPDSPPAGTIALPVHPAITDCLLERTLKDAGLDPSQVSPGPVSIGPALARPTLSLRTVVPLEHPQTHLKLPLPMRTLGRLNLRAITRTSLADGTVVGRVLRQIQEAESDFTTGVLVADESRWLHAGHPLLAVLIRHWDDDLTGARIVPVAALAAVGPDGKPVISVLAQEFWDGDLDQLIADLLRALLDHQLTLWLRYGVVLEAHPQNVLIAVDRTPDGPRLRLLLRDLDSARLDLELLTDRLGAAAPARADFADARMPCLDPVDLADLFVTTTLHQCVAAMLIAVALTLEQPVQPWLRLIRPLLAESADRYPDARDTALFRARITNATRLPVKRALTATTLLPKTRTGAADVNKYYGAQAPSYL